jgi:hypothetical protein
MKGEYKGNVCMAGMPPAVCLIVKDEFNPLFFFSEQMPFRVCSDLLKRITVTDNKEPLAKF